MTREFNEQENFWKETFGREYIQRNTEYNYTLLEKGWRKMLATTNGINSMLELGSNIGRNLSVLRKLYPMASLGLIEINSEAFDFAVNKLNPEYSHNGSILQSNFDNNQFDLTFSCGVMIHIAPDDLLDNLKKMYEYSNKYILIAEYFNATPISIGYHGKKEKLFKRDFGKFFLENFEVDVLDYGFLWSQEYQPGGFDDLTWWMFEKKN